MIECYYSSCANHDKDEPFCTKDICSATEEQVIIFRKERAAFLGVKELPLGEG